MKWFPCFCYSWLQLSKFMAHTLLRSKKKTYQGLIFLANLETPFQQLSKKNIDWHAYAQHSTGVEAWPPFTRKAPHSVFYSLTGHILTSRVSLIPFEHSLKSWDKNWIFCIIEYNTTMAVPVLIILITRKTLNQVTTTTKFAQIYKIWKRSIVRKFCIF